MSVGNCAAIAINLGQGITAYLAPLVCGLDHLTQVNLVPFGKEFMGRSGRIWKNGGEKREQHYSERQRSKQG